MAKSIAVKPKKRGRPATGRDPFVGIRLPEELIAEVGKWASANKAASRSEAIRRLVELGLATGQPRSRGSEQTGSAGRRVVETALAGQPSAVARTAKRAKASEMAGHEIDRRGDKSATDEERASRKRRLLKGPKEFRR